MAVIFVTGGARSGKTSTALHLAREQIGLKKYYIATAIAFDQEMSQRIENHKKERQQDFITIEEPYDLANALQAIKLPQQAVIIIDCLTLWVNNLLLKKQASSWQQFPQMIEFLKVLEETSALVIVVSNEVGMGIVPENQLARLFRDLSGSLNQQVANIAHKVILMVSGLPIALKN